MPLLNDERIVSFEVVIRRDQNRARTDQCVLSDVDHSTISRTQDHALTDTCAAPEPNSYAIVRIEHTSPTDGHVIIDPH